MHSDHVVGTDEKIDFAGAGDFLAGVPEREVQDEEEVVIVLIQLGTFFGAADVFQVERVDVRVAVVQRFDIGGAGMDDVNPGEVVVGDESGGHGRIIARIFTTEYGEGSEGGFGRFPEIIRKWKYFLSGKAQFAVWRLPGEKFFRQYGNLAVARREETELEYWRRSIGRQTIFCPTKPLLRYRVGRY